MGRRAAGGPRGHGRAERGAGAVRASPRLPGPQPADRGRAHRAVREGRGRLLGMVGDLIIVDDDDEHLASPRRPLPWPRHPRGRGRPGRTSPARTRSSATTTRPTSSAISPRRSSKPSPAVAAADRADHDADEDAEDAEDDEDAEAERRRRGRPTTTATEDRRRTTGAGRCVSRRRADRQSRDPPRPVAPGLPCTAFGPAPAPASSCTSERAILRPRPPPAVLVQHHRPGRGHVTIHFRTIGRGTEWFTRLRPGDRVDMLGPLGRPFEVDPRTRHLLLVAGGLGIAGVRALADEAIRDGRQVRCSSGGAGARASIPRRCCRTSWSTSSRPTTGPSATTATSRTCCPIRSVGRPGLRMRAAPDAPCPGPPGCPRRGRMGVANLGRKRGAGRPIPPVRPRPGARVLQVSMEQNMGCAVGACLGCVVMSTSGTPQRVCREGPVFAAESSTGRRLVKAKRRRESGAKATRSAAHRAPDPARPPAARARRRRRPGRPSAASAPADRSRRRRSTCRSTWAAASACRTRSSSRRGRSATASSTATSSTSSASARSAARARRSGRASATRPRA